MVFKVKILNVTSPNTFNRFSFSSEIEKETSSTFISSDSPNDIFQKKAEIAEKQDKFRAGSLIAKLFVIGALMTSVWVYIAAKGRNKLNVPERPLALLPHIKA